MAVDCSYSVGGCVSFPMGSLHSLPIRAADEVIIRDSSILWVIGRYGRL